VAALEIHVPEEYLTKFAPAMSRLFNITRTERSFLLVFAFIARVPVALTQNHSKLWVAATVFLIEILRRILLAMVITVTVIFISVQSITPVVLSFYAARKIPTVSC
jgi:hypothetical protein